MTDASADLLIPIWLGDAPDLDDLPRGARLPLDSAMMTVDTALARDAFVALDWYAEAVHFGGGEMQLLLTYPAGDPREVAHVLATAYADTDAYRALRLNGVEAATYALVAEVDTDGIPDEMYPLHESLGDAATEQLDALIYREAPGAEIARYLRGLTFQLGIDDDAQTLGSHPDIGESLFGPGL